MLTAKIRKYKKIFMVLIGILIIAVVAVKLFSNSQKSAKNTSPKAIVSESQEKVDLNKEFEFKVQVVNDQGQFTNKQDKLKFVITDAELKKEIKVKNESKKANDGQKYLVIRIELQNDNSDRLAIISNKYIRLIGEENKKFSPDFHNAMVAVDPLSVRRDLVAYIVNENSKSFTFQVGELDGPKQSLEIVF